MGIRRLAWAPIPFLKAVTPLPLTTIFASYYYTNEALRVRAAQVTKDLNSATAACQHSTGIPLYDISARSLRAGGAMALMCADQPYNTIKLIGQWQFNDVLRYLHQDAQPSLLTKTLPTRCSATARTTFCLRPKWTSRLMSNLFPPTTFPTQSTYGPCWVARR